MAPKIAIVVLLLHCSSALRPSQYGPGPNSNLPLPTSRASTNPNNFGGYERASSESNGPWDDSVPPLDHESVEERLAAWREQQRFKYEHQSAIDAANPRDEDGKMKLLASVSRGSIAMFFFILMWRAVHHYELADQTFNGATRLFMVLPPVVLFLGNMAGCVGSIMSNGALGKKRMKAILNLNKLVEVSLMAYNVMRLVLVPSKFVMREVYVGRTLSNFLFLIQCQLFTKVTWNAAQLKPSIGATERVYGNMNSSAGVDNSASNGEYEQADTRYEYMGDQNPTGSGYQSGDTYDNNNEQYWR